MEDDRRLKAGNRRAQTEFRRRGARNWPGDNRETGIFIGPAGAGRVKITAARATESLKVEGD